MHLSSQRDRDYCNAEHFRTTQSNSEPLKTYVLGGFLYTFLGNCGRMALENCMLKDWWYELAVVIWGESCNYEVT